MRWIIKYALGIVPLGLCLLVALYCVYAAEQGIHAVMECYHFTPEGLRNIAWIFVFAGVVFALMWFAFCLFLDWRAWDDRRQLRKSLEGDEETKGSPFGR